MPKTDKERTPALSYNCKIVYDEFKDIYREEGRPPSIRELLGRLDWAFKSPASIKYQLDNLVILGFLKRQEGTSRNYALIEDVDMQITRDASGVLEVARKIAYNGNMTLDEMLDLRREFAKMGIDYSRSTRG